MEDLIACLHPFQRSRYAIEAIKDPVNSPADCPRLVDATRQSPELQDRQSRETTAPPDDDYDERVPPQDRDPGLELRFSHKLQGGLGIVFGTNRKGCDIILPRLTGISRRHCYITFDDQRRLIVRDTSSYGTIVTYDDKGRERRSNFKWIIGGHQVPDKTETIVIEIHPELKFQIIVSKDHPHPDLFYDKVGQFLKEVATNDELPFGALGLDSAISTAAPSGRDTPNERPILLKRGKLGEGSFGVVSRVWDVSTGLEYASKKCRKPQAFDWRREADVMRNISHEHIVKLYFTLDGPHPQLLLEYLPLGNLEGEHYLQPLSECDVLTLLRQSSSALSYLHDQKPPLVHRDIKPENILVLSRSPFHVKLSDFGLANVGSYLESLCGTFLYAAPEIAQYSHSNSTGSPKYTCAVDIWSLGVVVFQYGYGLPGYCRQSSLSWCEQIVEKLRDWDPDSLLDILLGMLVINPMQRYSAEECLERAWELEGRQTPTPMSYGRQQREVGQSNLTAIDYFRDSEIQRYTRSQTPRHPGLPGFEGDIQQQGSLRSIQDCEIQGYIKSKIEDSLDIIRDAGNQVFIRSEVPLCPIAPTIVDKRKRSSATSSSSAGRTKRTVAKSSPGHLRYEEPSLGADAFAPGAHTQGSLSAGQSKENAGYSRVAMPGTSVRQSLANHGERVWTDSFVAACLLEEIHRKV